MATKVFDYAVIWGGEIVPPHTPIEVAEKNTATEKPEAEKSEAEKPKKKAGVKNDKRAD